MNDFPTETEHPVTTDTSVVDTPAAIVPPPPVEEVLQPVPERPLFVRVGLAYHTLLTKVMENQNVVREQRVQIAALRTRLRALIAENSLGDDDNEEDELRNNKLMVQTDDCHTLIQHVEQIREHIHQNAGVAETLLTPLHSRVELLTLRVQHIRAIEQLLANVKEGIRLQGRLTEADAVLDSLEYRLAAG